MICEMKDFPTPELPSNIKTPSWLSPLVRKRERESEPERMLVLLTADYELFTFNLPDRLSLTDNLCS